MALVITFTPGESFDETGDTITLNKLNRVINSGTGTISSGSIDTDNIGDLQVTAAKLADALNLTGKAVTLPVGIDLSKGVATGLNIEAMGIPTHLGQIGVLTGGKVFVSKGITSTADWVYGGYFIVTGAVSPANLTEDSRSLLGTPDAVGQWAIDSAGVTYRAQEPDEGDLTHNDWLPIRTHTIDFKNQVSTDPDTLDDHVRLYAKGNDLHVLQDDGTVIQVQATGQGGVYIVQNIQAQGQQGQLLDDSVWDQIELNTEITTGSTFASLVTNRVRLNAGNYEFDYFVNFEITAGETFCTARLYDETANAVIADGSSNHGVLSAYGPAQAFGMGFFTITEQSDIEIQGYVYLATANIGYAANTPGTQELYVSLRFRRHL